MSYSIEDVAKQAGVSIATVSRVVNNANYPVSEKTRAKVEKAIKELDYVPNISAQNLRQSYSNVIGFIARDLSDTYYGEMARGVTEEALKHGVLSFICNTGRKSSNEWDYHKLFNQYKIRGLILGGGGVESLAYKNMLENELKQYKERNGRIVAAAPQGFEVDSVMVDNIAMAEMVVDYLLKRGHREILFLGGPEQVVTSLKRKLGYVKALKKYGISPSDELMLHTNSAWADGYTSIQKALQERIKFTAICCINDNIAISAIHALNDAGYEVPRDISIVSMGGLPNSLYSTPVLTTAVIPLYDIGVKAVDLVLKEERVDDTVETILFKTKLREGQSVRAV